MNKYDFEHFRDSTLNKISYIVQTLLKLTGQRECLQKKKFIMFELMAFLNLKPLIVYIYWGLLYQKVNLIY